MLVKKDKLKAVLAKLSVFTSGGCGAGDKTTPVLFEAKDGTISLTACDGSNFGVFSFEGGAAGESLSFVTEFSRLQSAAALRGDADFKVENGELFITRDETSLHYPAADADTYGFTEKSFENGKSFQIGGADLKKLIAKVSYARKEKDARLYVTGVHFSCDGETLMTEATDAMRFLRNTLALAEKKDFTFSCILSPTTLRAIDTLEDDKTLTVTVDDRAIGLSSDTARVYMPTLNAAFPNISKYFDSANPTAHFTLDKSVVQESLEIFSYNRDPAMTITKENGQLRFLADSGDSKITDTVVAENMDGDDFSFSVDRDIYRDLFANLKGGTKVIFDVSEDDRAPIIVHDEENFIGLVMKLRKQ